MALLGLPHLSQGDYTQVGRSERAQVALSSSSSLGPCSIAACSLLSPRDPWAFCILG